MYDPFVVEIARVKLQKSTIYTLLLLR